MTRKDSSGKYVDDIVTESDVVAKARAQSIELGITPISPAVGAQAALIVAATGAASVAEIGTGVGVSGLWLLSASRTATLSSIDSEVEHQQLARAFFTEAGISANRVRLITGRAREVLPRMNEDSYDVVFVDADPQPVIEYVEHALRLARPGGTMLVAHALWHDQVPDPVKRDDVVTGYRSLITEIASSSAVVSAVNPADDGLLQITKLP